MLQWFSFIKNTTKDLKKQKTSLHPHYDLSRCGGHSGKTAELFFIAGNAMKYNLQQNINYIEVIL